MQHPSVRSRSVLRGHIEDEHADAHPGTHERFAPEVRTACEHTACGRMRDTAVATRPTVGKRELAEPVEQRRRRAQRARGQRREVEATSVDARAVIPIAVGIVLARRLVRKGEAQGAARAARGEVLVHERRNRRLLARLEEVLQDQEATS